MEWEKGEWERRGHEMEIVGGIGAYQFRIFGPENLGQLEEPYPLEKDGIHDPGGDKGSLPDGSHLA